MSSEEVQVHKIIPDSYRFVNLVLFLLVAIINGMPCQAFAGISPAIADIYNISTFQANANSLFFPILYVLLVLPANYIIDQKGLKIGTLTCQFFMCVGLTIRCLINYNYYYFLLGTFICSLGFCFVSNSANKVPNIWFLDKQILPTKSVILFALFASDTLGYYLSTVFISKQSNKADVQRFFIIQSGIMILFHVLNAIFFRDTPKTPQNYSSQIVRQQYRQNLKKLLKNKNYIKVFFSITFVFSCLTILFVAIPWLGQGYNISTDKCGYILVIANGSGLFACAISGLIYKNVYKRKCQIFLIASYISLSIMWIGFQFNKIWVIYVAAAFAGCSIFPFLTTILDFGTQVAFPIGQATTGGSLLFGGQTIGFIMIIAFSIYIGDQVTIFKCRITNALVLLLFVLSFISLHFCKQDLKRNKYQDKRKVQQKASLLSEQAKYLDNY